MSAERKLINALADGLRLMLMWHSEVRKQAPEIPSPMGIDDARRACVMDAIARGEEHDCAYRGGADACVVCDGTLKPFSPTEEYRLVFEALEVLEDWECSDRIAPGDHATLATLFRIRDFCERHRIIIDVRHGNRSEGESS